MDAQTRLLRVLQQGEYTTVGGRTPIKTNVRIIAASNKDLRLLIQHGLFREDLFFRLKVVPLRLPPLRERTEDVPDLTRHFFSLAAAEGLPMKHIENAALDRMLPAEVGALVPSTPNGAGGERLMSLPLREAREVFEREYLVAQISRFGGNISRTAEFIGMVKVVMPIARVRHL